MYIIVLILSIIIFIKTLSYGIFEVKEHKNKSGRNMRYSGLHSFFINP